MLTLFFLQEYFKMNENVANIVRDTIVRMTAEANEKRRISDTAPVSVIPTRLTIDRDVVLTYPGIGTLSEKLDSLRAVILVEPVQSSRHTYSVEVRNAKSDSETLLKIEAADFTPLYKDVLSSLKDTTVTNGKIVSVRDILEARIEKEFISVEGYRLVGIDNIRHVFRDFVSWVVETGTYDMSYVQQDKPNLRFEYDVESERWVVYANRDFASTKSRNIITKGTKGGTVSDPTLILGNTWIEEGSYVEGHSVLKDVEVRNDSGVDDSILYNTLVEVGGRVTRSFVFDSTLESTTVVNCRLIGCNYLTSYLYNTHGLQNSNDYVHYSCGNDQRFIAVEAKSQCFNPITADNVGTEGGQMIVGVTVTGDVKIIRGCFHGTLEEFKDKIDENFGRTTLDSEQYYAFAKYMHDKVASKRYHAILPLVQESLKVFDCLNGVSFRPSYSNHPIFSTRIPNYNNGVSNLLRAIDEYDKFKVYYHSNFN
jgi:hypothetical protein